MAANPCLAGANQKDVGSRSGGGSRILLRGSIAICAVCSASKYRVFAALEGVTVTGCGRYVTDGGGLGAKDV
jgi:hypothetical protein